MKQRPLPEPLYDTERYPMAIKVGDFVDLSTLREGDAASLEGKSFIVTARFPEDRQSGVTEIMFEDGKPKSFTWDVKDPKVKYLGTGKVSIKIKE